MVLEPLTDLELSSSGIEPPTSALMEVQAELLTTKTVCQPELLLLATRLVRNSDTKKSKCQNQNVSLNEKCFVTGECPVYSVCYQ